MNNRVSSNIELLGINTEATVFDRTNKPYGYYNKEHAAELSELSYTYLVECLTKSNKELREDLKFHMRAMDNILANYYPNINMPEETYYAQRNALFRIYNRHSLIAYIAKRLLSVVDAKVTEKLDLLMQVTDTPIFSAGIEYAENHPRYFPGFSCLMENVELVSFLDNRYLFSRKG